MSSTLFPVAGLTSCVMRYRTEPTPVVNYIAAKYWRLYVHSFGGGQRPSLTRWFLFNEYGSLWEPKNRPSYNPQLIFTNATSGEPHSGYSAFISRYSYIGERGVNGDIWFAWYMNTTATNAESVTPRVVKYLGLLSSNLPGDTAPVDFSIQYGDDNINWTTLKRIKCGGWKPNEFRYFQIQ